MGPVRQNPIQRTVSSVHNVCSSLCTVVAHNTAQNRPDNFPSCPPDNHHCSDDVYLRERGGGSLRSTPSEWTQRMYVTLRPVSRYWCILAIIRYEQTEMPANSYQGRSDGGISVYIPSQNLSLKIILCTNIAADVVRLLVYRTVVSCSKKIIPTQNEFLATPLTVTIVFQL